MARMFRGVVPGAEECECIENTCCECWLQGCYLNSVFGVCADCLEVINPFMEQFADCIWVLGSPLAFPIIFCFPPGPETDPPGGGWQLSMLAAPLKKPLQCCLYTACCPCGQWHMRRRLLDYDMTKYKLWQGYHDGPQCCARRCPGAPITIRSGTYGESDCPNTFLCLEVCCLAGVWSVCCAFGVNRRMMKDERNLGEDPTEVRVNDCIGFFSRLARQCFMLGCCVCLASCLIGICAPDSVGAQECAGEGGRAARSCKSCAYTCWRGIWSVKIIAMGCMSAQMDYEIKAGQPLDHKPVPVTEKMERGDPEDEIEDGEEAWWKKAPQNRG